MFNLSKFLPAFGQRRVPLSANDNPRPALLVIDVQKEFCDPGRYGNEETQIVSEHIQSIVPEFRKAGIAVYAIYFNENPREPAPMERIGFYKFTPAPQDIMVGKSSDSAFDGKVLVTSLSDPNPRKEPFEETLTRNGHTKLIACGFNLRACVLDTILDANRKGFDITLLGDLSGNDRRRSVPRRDSLARVKDAGAHISTSAQALSAIMR